ncbi:hypothetical protein BDZ91DRAFT_255530 [Kalaharituber pfeilii]|nr:hypothetical protein BDZ91DRAFT_255530 [Kalaharituber pfeilii]
MDNPICSPSNSGEGNCASSSDDSRLDLTPPLESGAPRSSAISNPPLDNQFQAGIEDDQYLSQTSNRISSVSSRPRLQLLSAKERFESEWASGHRRPVFYRSRSSIYTSMSNKLQTHFGGLNIKFALCWITLGFLALLLFFYMEGEAFGTTWNLQCWSWKAQFGDGCQDLIRKEENELQ